MNILYDYDIFLRQRFGGISRYFYELITRIIYDTENLIDVCVFMGINNFGYNFNKINPHVNIKDYKFIGADKLHFLFSLLNEKLFNKYSRNANFELLHKTYYSNIELGFKSKNLVTVHDMTHELYPNFFAKGDSTSMLKKKSIHSADAIICVSETTKNDLVNMFPLENKKIKVIYHGINLTKNEKDKKYIKEPYILYVGQRWGYKNFNI